MTMTDHLAALFARYRETHDLPDAPAAELLITTGRDQHKAWLSRHLSRCAAAEILDPYGFEVQKLLTSERARLRFDNGARILVERSAGGALPHADDFDLAAFDQDGREVYHAMSKGALDLRHALEAARELVDPSLISPCEAQ